MYRLKGIGTLLPQQVFRVRKHLQSLGYKGLNSKKGLKYTLGKVLGIPVKDADISYLVQQYINLTFLKEGLPLEVIQDPNSFYNTEEWRSLREVVFQVFGKRCLCCGSKENLQVDHVVPRSVNPLIALKVKNLQPLCKICNGLKGTLVIDYRDPDAHLTRKASLEKRRKTFIKFLLRNKSATVPPKGTK